MLFTGIFATDFISESDKSGMFPVCKGYLDLKTFICNTSACKTFIYEMFIYETFIYKTFTCKMFVCKYVLL